MLNPCRLQDVALEQLFAAWEGLGLESDRHCRCPYPAAPILANLLAWPAAVMTALTGVLSSGVYRVLRMKIRFPARLPDSVFAVHAWMSRQPGRFLGRFYSFVVGSFKQVLHAPLGRSAALSAYQVPEFWVVVQDFQVRVIHRPSRVGVA
jgi:hypothetical protein